MLHGDFSLGVFSLVAGSSETTSTSTTPSGSSLMSPFSWSVSSFPCMPPPQSMQPAEPSLDPPCRNKPPRGLPSSSATSVPSAGVNGTRKSPQSPANAFLAMSYAELGSSRSPERAVYLPGGIGPSFRFRLQLGLFRQPPRPLEPWMLYGDRPFTSGSTFTRPVLM